MEAASDVRFIHVSSAFSSVLLTLVGPRPGGLARDSRCSWPLGGHSCCLPRPPASPTDTVSEPSADPYTWYLRHTTQNSACGWDNFLPCSDCWVAPGDGNYPQRRTKNDSYASVWSKKYFTSVLKLHWPPAQKTPL